MLDSKPINKVVFLDIETTSKTQHFSELSEKMQSIFKKRFKKEWEEIIEKNKMAPDVSGDLALGLQKQSIANDLESLYSLKAPLFAEFNRILCISIGVININNPDVWKIAVSSFASDNEKELLEKFLARTAGITANSGYSFCAHNGKMFDFPVISKRLIINGLPLPKMFDFAEIKPWEVSFIDTKEVWKFGVYDNHTSLDLLAEIFGVESSKDDMEGSEVKNVYYVNKDLPRIVKYCEKDVVALARIYLKMKGLQNEIVI